MKKYLWMLLAVLVAACTPKEVDPVSQALIDALTKDVQGPCSIKIDNLRLLDSTTFATEFQRRIGIYDLRLNQNTERMEKYLREGKKKNATKMFEELKHDTKVYNELMGMKEMMADDTLNTAYYDYSFTYGGKVGDKKLPSREAWATVTPDGRVITLVSDEKDLHKDSGLVIPGYQELLDSFKQEEE